MRSIGCGLRLSGRLPRRSDCEVKVGVAELVYALCAATSLLCAALLIRSYRATRQKLLLWSSLCFGGLAINNGLLFIDLVVVPEITLEAWRTGVALVAVALLIFGLIWEAA